MCVLPPLFPCSPSMRVAVQVAKWRDKHSEACAKVTQGEYELGSSRDELLEALTVRSRYVCVCRGGARRE